MSTNVRTRRYSRVKTSAVVSTRMEATAVAAKKVTSQTVMDCVKVNRSTLITS